MNTINPAGYFFYWRENSPFIEVFRENDPLECPFEVIWAGDMDYDYSNLKVIANSSREYANA